MDSDRTHRTGSSSSTSSELFICFTSRLSSSSSSMKLSSKSILSPGRARDPPVSLSTSLSRRLRTNGSIKGGQASPMFPTGSKKRGCAFENPEPSSPKVTCIGQVRVKTKKQGKKMRTLSKRRSGEASFRKAEQAREGASQNQIQTQTFQQTNASNQYQQQQQECLPNRNQRWVQLPLTICEALRAFGAEFSCLFPCRSSCFSTSEREKEEKAVGMGLTEENRQSSCGAVFARWLVAMQDGEVGKGREIELVVAGDNERTELPERTLRNSRRHAFDDIEIKGEKCEGKDEVVEEEEARVSICIPPKNALLLMRCRSDPMRMAALTNRFWESPGPEDDEEQEEDDHKEYDEEDKDVLDEKEQVVEESEVKDEVEMEQKEDKKRASVEIKEEQENSEVETNLEVEELEAEDNEQEKPEEKLQISEELEEAEQEKQKEQTEVRQAVGTENELSDSSSEAIVDQESTENEDDDSIQEKEEERRATYPSSSAEESDGEEGEHEAEALAEAAALEEEEEDEEEKSNSERETHERTLEDQELTVTQERSEAGPAEETYEEEEQEGSNLEEIKSESHDHEEVERKSNEVTKQERESSVLPDCLLLMMCEPKLSMEVSKETWVCSTDFIRWLPERPVNPKEGFDEPKKRVSTDSNRTLPPLPAHHHHHNQTLLQPPRSSCSLPAAAAAVSGMSMTTMIEQKLVNAVAYEPFVLTRCKSEPMRTAAKLAPDACFWKNRKLEPHGGATFGVGAAGVGF